MWIKRINVNERNEETCVDEGDICELKRCIEIKEMSLSEEDECRWIKWVWEDCSLWMKKMCVKRFIFEYSD